MRSIAKQVHPELDLAADIAAFQARGGRIEVIPGFTEVKPFPPRTVNYADGKSRNSSNNSDHLARLNNQHAQSREAKLILHMVGRLKKEDLPALPDDLFLQTAVLSARYNKSISSLLHISWRNWEGFPTPSKHYVGSRLCNMFYSQEIKDWEAKFLKAHGENYAAES